MGHIPKDKLLDFLNFKAEKLGLKVIERKMKEGDEHFLSLYAPSEGDRAEDEEVPGQLVITCMYFGMDMFIDGMIQGEFGLGAVVRGSEFPGYVKDEGE